MTKEEWDPWWNDFLRTKKLRMKVRELDESDCLVGIKPLTKELCYEVYNNYDAISKQREQIKQDLVNVLGKLEQVHLQSGRVKTKESLIEKIIRKRHEYIGSKTSGYACIDSANYSDIITDLVGIRLIVNYRGKWQDIHKEVLNMFPLMELSSYNGVEHLPHVKGKSFLAEIPKAYYAPGDSIEQFIEANLEVKEHTQGYRSIHYVISYQNCYVELQVRTIYDEAWSDCDHSYVYKHEAKPNNRALKKLSHILCEITNVANDIGDNMHDIYEDERLSDADGDVWKASSDDICFFNKMINKLKKAEAELEDFANRLEIGNY